MILELAKEPFGAEAARELCRLPGIFNLGELYKRERICEVLREEFVRRGGSRDTSKQNIASVLKKWLGGGESPFRKEARGRYRFMGFPDQVEYADNSLVFLFRSAIRTTAIRWLLRRNSGKAPVRFMPGVFHVTGKLPGHDGG